MQPFSIFWSFSFLLILVLDWKKIPDKSGIDSTVLLAGNFIIYAATALSFWLTLRSVNSTNPHASIRSLYGSFMLKFFLIVIAAFIYIMIARKNVNKPALFICMGLYLVYTFMEVYALQKLLKEKKVATSTKNQDRSDRDGPTIEKNA